MYIGERVKICWQPAVAANATVRAAAAAVANNANEYQETFERVLFENIEAIEIGGIGSSRSFTPSS
jgi:hypothetical protein